MKIVVTGSLGYISQLLAKELVQKGQIIPGSGRTLKEKYPESNFLFFKYLG